MILSAPLFGSLFSLYALSCISWGPTLVTKRLEKEERSSRLVTFHVPI